MTDVSLVVPACFPDIFTQFRISQERWEPDYFHRKILVRDGHTIVSPEGWCFIQGPDPYVMPRNINLGLRAAGRDDVVMASDDTEFTDPGSVGILQEVAYRYPRVAIVSPVIDGGCGIPEQKADAGWQGEMFVPKIAFIFIYVRRAIIDLIGGWDENFTSYGHDDYDYCERIQRVGWNIVVTSKVVVKHGFDSPCMNTYMRKGNADTAAGQRLFAEKWNA